MEAIKYPRYAGRERQEARISVNKLGEYLVGGVLTRRRILKDQKRPKDYIVAAYQHASVPIVEYLRGGATDPGVLLSAIERIEPLAGTATHPRGRSTFAASRPSRPSWSGGRSPSFGSTARR